MRTVLVGAGFFACLSLALATVNTEAAIMCIGSEKQLMYPVYNKRGVITDYTKRCGDVHRGCTERTDTEIYDCSPFMAPKDVL